MVSINDSEGYQGSGLPKIDNTLLFLAFSLKNGYPSVQGN